MTTNAGSEKQSAVTGFSTGAEDNASMRVEKALERFLRPEFLNRVDEIITFRHLDKSDFKKIASIMIRKLSDHLIEKGIVLKVTPAVYDHIAQYSFSEKYGARNMRRYIEKEIEDKIANIIIDSFPSKVSAVSIGVKNAELKFDSI